MRKDADPNDIARFFSRSEALRMTRPEYDAVCQAQERIQQFLDSNCDVTGTVCGDAPWILIIDGVNIMSIAGPGARIDGVGHTDDGVNPAAPFLFVGAYCPNAGQYNCDTPSKQAEIISAIQSATNTNGMSVGAALANWGLPSTISLNIRHSPMRLLPGGGVLMSTQRPVGASSKK